MDGTRTLTFDRRKLPRRPIGGGAMAVFSSGPGPSRLGRVELIDASWTGIGVRSGFEVEVGSAVSLVPEDAMRPRAVGIVVRCVSTDKGFHLGIVSRLSQAVA